MGVDFDVAEFCRKLRQSEGPYKCPIETCDKVYQSVVGMNYHLLKFDHANPHSNDYNDPTTGGVPSVKTPHHKASTPKPRSSMKSGRKKKSSHRAPLLKNAVDQQMIQTAREGLTYAEAQIMVEFEIQGKTTRVEISQPLKYMSKEDFDASHNKLDDSIKQEDIISTPNRKHSHTPGGKKSKISKTAAAAAAAAAASQQAESKISLPEASFKVLSNYNITDAPPRPTSAYIRFIEKSAEELDGEVEYDMDEEDSAWLSIINERRSDGGLPPVPVDAFELLMDRLEKESYFMMQVSGKGPEGVPSIIDDDAVCCICMDGECQNSNVILFCDMCNLAVHQDCYGVPYIPEGQWLCRRCLQSPSRAVDCVLCPNNGGAFKQTDRGHWAHVVCALWIPEVRFANTVFLEPIDSIETIPSARWKLTCYICKQRGVGACIQCHKTNCYAAFHVTCAQQAGLYMKMDTVRDTEPGPIMVQKTAFCDTHTPPDAEPRPKINSRTGGGILAMSPSGDAASSSGSLNSPGSPDEIKDKMKNARRILAKRRSWAPIISIPTIPPERIQEIATHVAVPKKNQFIQRLIAYWTLKRQFRNGVPLLRRLQSSHLQRRDERRGEAPEASDTTELYRQLKYWQCLRQDLERARLLCELVRKREKLKKEYIRVKEQETLMTLAPLQGFMRQLLDAIKARDTGDIFGEPVDQNEVLDYADVVKEPMDLSTMRLKLDSHEYQTLDDFHHDFILMVNNCLAYNSKETVFYRAGIKMRDQGGALIRQARRHMEVIGFDPETGLLLDTPGSEHSSGAQKLQDASSDYTGSSKKRTSEIHSSAPEELAADIDMELDRILNEGKNLALEEKLEKLLDLKDLVKDLKSAIARNKREKAIRIEIANVRRKLSLLASGKVQGMRKKSSKSDTEEKTDTNTELEETTEEEEELHVSAEERTETEVKRGRKRKLREESDEEHASTRESQRHGINSFSSPGKDGSRSSAIGTATTPVRQEANTSGCGGSLTSASPSGVNRRTAVLFTRKAASVRKSDTPDNQTSSNKDYSHPTSGKRRGGRPRKNLDSALGIGSEGGVSVSSSIQTLGNVDDLMPAPPVPCSDSFRQYRSSGDIVAETDDDTQSETSCSSCVSTGGSSGSSCSDADGEGEEDGYASSVDATVVASSGEDDDARPKPPKHDRGLLPPLQLVWAKCRGYPWYPALIIDPEMPAGYMHNGVPIPAPPDDVLALKSSCKEPVHLVLFFDTKRTWQWLPRNKLEVLGEDKKLDQAKLSEARKPADRKAVRRAFKDAILHRIEVTGTELKGNAQEAIALLEEEAS